MATPLYFLQGHVTVNKLVPYTKTCDMTCDVRAGKVSFGLSVWLSGLVLDVVLSLSVER